MDIRKSILINRLEVLIGMKNSREIEVVGEKPENLDFKEKETYRILRYHSLSIDPKYTSLSKRISYTQDKILDIDQIEILNQYSGNKMAYHRLNNKKTKYSQSDVFPLLTYS